MELQSAIEQMSYYSDEPSADAGALPVWFLSKMSRQQVTVALSGEGADELSAATTPTLRMRMRRTLRMVPKPFSTSWRSAVAAAARCRTKRSVSNTK